MLTKIAAKLCGIYLFLNLKQRESHSCYKEIFHVAYYNVITPDLAFVMTGFLPIGEY